MRFVSVDVEADGACPGIYNLISIGAKVVGEDKSFYAEMSPLTDNFDPKALLVCGFTREEQMTLPSPERAIKNFYSWVKGLGRVTLISDNPAFDWQFVNYYLIKFCGDNPFGFSARRIGDIYCGLKRDLSANREWKRLRKTKHSHNALDDAKGNAEAFEEILKML